MSAGTNGATWQRSFYWRIALSFAVLMLAVFAAQSLLFSYLMARADGDPFASPNRVASAVASEFGNALRSDASLDAQALVVQQYGQSRQRIYIVLDDGRVVSNTGDPLADDLVRQARALLRGDRPGLENDGSTHGPVVSAPIAVGGVLRGMVILPPPPGGIAREAGRLLSLPGMLLLMAATALAAIVIFAPARRRLRDLEAAALRLGAGDLAARAPAAGGDEIAHVAQAFNQMAAALAARDQALRASDELRRQMLADVSHELRTPLTTIRAYVDTLQMPDVDGDADRRGRYLAVLSRESGRLEKIVADLLDLAKYENSAVRFDERVFAVRRVFDHVVRRHEHEAETRGIAVVVTVSEAADQLVGDPDRLEQAVENLFVNALRYTPPGGAIALDARVEGDWVALTVSDTGTGIPPEHLPRIFDRFYRVDVARSPDAGGSGLGLAIVKAVAERLGGTVGASSENGTTRFEIRLPLPVDRIAPLDRSAERQPASTNL